MAGNRGTKTYAGSATVTYTTNTMNQITAASGTRTTKIDVTGSFTETNIEKVEVFPTHDGTTRGSTVDFISRM